MLTGFAALVPDELDELPQAARPRVRARTKPAPPRTVFEYIMIKDLRFTRLTRRSRPPSPPAVPPGPPCGQAATPRSPRRRSARGAPLAAAAHRDRLPGVGREGQH